MCLLDRIKNSTLNSPETLPIALTIYMGLSFQRQKHLYVRHNLFYIEVGDPNCHAQSAPAKRVMSLKEPTSKMSKSHADERSRILLSDSTEEIHKKINAALTDSDLKISYDPVHRPGVSNLIDILSHFEGLSCDELVLEHESVSLRALKERVSTAVANHMKGIREKYLSLIDDKTGYLDSAAEEGAQAACANTELTMKRVRTALGL